MHRLVIALAILMVSRSHAAEASCKTLMASPGTPVFTDALDQAPVEPAWKAAKGEWKVVDGSWRARELSADHHGAVARRALAVTNFVLRCEVRLDGAKGTSISINGPKEHLARVSFGPKGVQVRKDDRDHDGPDKAKTFANRLKAIPAPGEWHTVVLEMVGDTMVASVDGELAGWGADPSFNQLKGNVGLTVAGEFAAFRNLTVWNASVKPEWPATRTTIETTP